MKKCIRCGNAEKDNATVCSRCGGGLVKDVKRCRNCGTEVDADKVFCIHCGSPLAEAPAPVSYRPAPVKKPKSNMALTIVLSTLCVLLVACIAMIAVLVANRDEDSHTGKKEETTQTGEENSAPEEDPLAEPMPEEKPKESTYYVYRGDLTWNEANINAQSMGGDLVCVNSYDEFTKVCALANDAGLQVFWLGATRDYEEQSWSEIRWTNGDSFTYTSWYPGEPSYYEDGVPEYYLMAFKVNGVWYFNDAINDVSKYYSGKIGYIVETEETLE